MKKSDIDKYKELFENAYGIKNSKESETFKKLTSLQKLIKKESSLREMCTLKNNNIIIFISSFFYSFKNPRRY